MRLTPALLSLVLVHALFSSAQEGPSSPSAPSARSLDETVYHIVETAIEQKQVPGAMVLIGGPSGALLRKAYGYRSLEPTRERMTADTIFDIASLTKVIATTTAIMQLVENGSLRLNDPVAKYLPEFAQNGKQDVTVRDLLTHFSGLPEDLDLGAPWQGKETAYRMAFEAKLADPPGARFRYSDINFIVLGALVEKLSGETLDAYCEKQIFSPLNMAHTRFNPPAPWTSNIAPTQFDEHNHMLRGVVHDPTARRMGGVAGHAGLFSTADDLAAFAHALLAGSAVLSSAAVEKMTTPQQPPTAGVLRGFGWDLDSPFSSPRGSFLPVGSFGHTGFTGTSLWIDRDNGLYIIILTNAVHPRGGNAIDLRARIASAVGAQLRPAPNDAQRRHWLGITGYNEAESALRRVSARNGSVLTGIDVLEKDGFRELSRFHSIGLLTNQTGIDAHGARTIDVLAHVPGLSLSAIFSPEHGVSGSLDTTAISNSKDEATGVRVYSVYGDTDAKRHPPLEAVKALDAIVVDLQDAGARFYTYETTLGYFLEAAAAANKPILVLDRPDPVTGSFVQGPVSDTSHQSFTNYFPLPVRHGMTIGELARMFNARHNINAQLTVIPMQGWLRGDWFDSTGLLWTNPSPNLRSLSEATLYPGVAMIEGSNVSVGRGTDTPFEVVGAPWIDANQLSAYLNAREIAGVRFVPVRFTPSSSTYANQSCQGVNIFVTARNTLDAPELGLELSSALYALYPQSFHLEKMADLLANTSVYESLKSGEDPGRIEQDIRQPLEDFMNVRKEFLLYP